MRQVSIIRAMRQQKPVRIRLFVHPGHRELTSQLLPGSDTDILTYPGGLTFVYNEQLDFKVSATFRAILRYAFYDGWRDFRYFLKAVKQERPVLIVNDFLPLVPLYAQLTKIPVAGVYNYLLAETSLGKGPLRRLLGWCVKRLFLLVYRLCHLLVLERLQPSSDHHLGNQVPLVARSQTRPADVVRQQIAAADKPLIFLSLGGGNTPLTERYLARFGTIAREGRWQFLLLPRTPEEEEYLRREQSEFLIGNNQWVETQDIIAACDLVITRAGFSTVAECLKARVPPLIWHLATHPEIRETDDELLRSGLSAGRLYPDDDTDVLREKIARALDAAEVRGRIADIPTDGAEQTAALILKMLDQA